MPTKKPRIQTILEEKEYKKVYKIKVEKIENLKSKEVKYEMK